MKKSERKTSEAFKRKVLARWRLLSVRGIQAERAAVQACVLFAPEHRGSRPDPRARARPPQYPGPLRNSRLKPLKRDMRVVCGSRS